MTSDETTTMSSGYTVLCAALDGSVTHLRHGLFHQDARVVSRYRLSLADSTPELVSERKPGNDRWEAVLRVASCAGAARARRVPKIVMHMR